MVHKSSDRDDGEGEDGHVPSSVAALAHGAGFSAEVSKMKLILDHGCNPDVTDEVRWSE